MTDKNLNEYCVELEKLGIENQIVEHPATKKIAEVLEYLHLLFSDCVPTLIMKGDGRYLAIVIRGDTRADFKKIKKSLGIKDLRMATPEEFTTLTNLPVGAARVYTPGIETILDTKVFEKEYLMGGSGRFDCSIKYKTANFKNIPNSKIADISA